MQNQAHEGDIMESSTDQLSTEALAKGFQSMSEKDSISTV